MLTLDDVIYMIMTDRFARKGGEPSTGIDPDDPKKRHGGNLLGIVERMPYLKDLGVTTLWMTPFYLNPPDSYHGYHPLDFDAVDPHLCSPELGPTGSRETIRRFVEIAHEHEFKVMIDMIVSHTGKEHPWLDEHPELINWTGEAVEKRWFERLPNINHDSLDANIYFIRNVLNWIRDTDVDAVRIDAARHVESQFWEEFKLYSLGLFPTVTVVGEFWDSKPHCVAPFQNVHGFHTMFDFPMYHAVRDVFIDNHPFDRLARRQLSDDEVPGILDLDPIYRNAYQLITFIGNHDTPRFFEKAGGNEHPEPALTRMKMALAFVMTARGIPQLYYGDELAMPGGMDPDNRRDMPWHLLEVQAQDTPEVQRAHNMLSWTRRLVGLRRGSPALLWGMSAPLYVSDTLYIVLRFTLEDLVIVAFNKGVADIDLRIGLWENQNIPTLVKALLSDGLAFQNQFEPSQVVQLTEGTIRVRLSHMSTALYRARPVAT